MNLNTKIIVIILLMALVTLALGFIGFSNTERKIAQDIFAKLDAIAQIQKNRVQAVLNDRQDLFDLFATKPLLRSYLRDYNARPALSLQKSMDYNLQETKGDSSNIKEIFVANTAGIIVASTSPALIGTDISAEYFFKQGIKQDDISIFKKDNAGNIKQYLAGPLFLNGEILGMAVIVIDADEVIGLANDYTGLGNTGETLLVKNDGNGGVLFLTPVRFDHDAALSLAVPKERTDIAAVHAVAGEENIFRNILDYRNTPVFAATRYIKSTGWGIVVKIDQAEALAPIKELQRMVLFLIGIAGFFIFLGGILISRYIVRPIKKLIAGAEKIAQGDLSQNIKVASQDEISALGRAFNVMAAKLKESYANLEKKVQDRTQDFENAAIAAQNVYEDLEIEKEELAKAMVKDEALLASIGDGVIAIDNAGIIIMINRAAEALLGYKSGEFLGKKVYDMLPIEDAKGNKLLPEERPLHASLFEGKTVITDEYFYEKKDGTKISVAITVAPVVLNKNIIGSVNVFRDITKEKEIDKAKTEFVSLASHQLRTPLTTTKWYSEMLLEGEGGKLTLKQKKYINELHQGNERMINLVRNLLNVSRIEMGALAVNPEPADAGKILKEVIKEQSPFVKEKKQKIIVEIQDTMPKISTDVSLARMIFQNIFGNAVKYTEPGGEIICRAEKKGSEIIIEIKDSGIGIIEKQQNKIFQKLFRGDNAAKEHPEGTGLELYITKAMVDALSGKIWFKSKEGEGTTFWIALPLEGPKIRPGQKIINNHGTQNK